MTGEELADALERLAIEEADHNARGYVAGMGACRAKRDGIVSANLPLILRHLRAGSDAAVYRAASAIEPMVGRPCTGALDIARAAIRAAVTP